MSQKRRSILYRKSAFYWVILIMVSIGVGSFFYNEMGKPILDEDINMKNIGLRDIEKFPDYIKIKNLGNGNRLVVNSKDGYEVEVEKGWFVYNKEEIEKFYLNIQNYEESNNIGAGIPDCQATINVKNKKLNDPFSYTKEKCDLYEDCESFEVNEENYNNIKWYRTSLFGGYVGAGAPEYITGTQNKIYEILFYCSDESKIKNILKNFKF